MARWIVSELGALVNLDQFQTVEVTRNGEGDLVAVDEFGQEVGLLRRGGNIKLAMADLIQGEDVDLRGDGYHAVKKVAK